ncbi:DUF4123 domain-containing protein [Pseudomonas xanthosomatis]|uniref:DUF4123 domain-containing protein n=1 Tax=Pseudomonas xanthosomatis TaxID=2842356 RepID=UPI001C3CA6D7|nr:DUF4123 domain-containing protein [Pseudomonas xanthosomatis]QXH46270.1 DUF4123 domain-containing protein [Pseudomonas xanthosomatis]
MPESILRALLATPTCTLGALEPVEQLVFVIDLGIEPDALASLYQLGEPFEPTLLFKDSEFEALAWQGPCSFSAAPGSVLAEKAAELCLARRCGMVLAAANSEQAVAHVRTLLKVNDGSGGQSLLSLGKPHLWAALALTSDAQAPRLFGPLSQVLTPVPAHLEVAGQPWYLWPAPIQQQGDRPQWPYNLPPGFRATARSLRLLYWLDGEHAIFGSPKGSEVATAVANLETLIEHGMSEGRYLKQLHGQVNGPLLLDDAQAMAILRSDAKPSAKSEQLAGLAG